MLWDVPNEWTSSTQFTFNCYRYWATLVLHNLEGSGHLFHSKKGVNQ